MEPDTIRILIPALIRHCNHPDPCVRFWSVFALGQIATPEDDHIKEVLLAKTADDQIAAGYWSVGREAQCALIGFNDSNYLDSLRAEWDALGREGSALDREWAFFYGSQTPA